MVEYLPNPYPEAGLDGAAQRFFKSYEVDPDTGCWLWTRSLRGEGYGQFTALGRRAMPAHRFAYMLLVGPIPVGAVLHHLCEVKRCVNPLHLRPTTDRENLLASPRTWAARNAAKTHCPRGHLYDEVNTYRNINGSRGCKTCRNASRRTPEYRAQARERRRRLRERRNEGER